MSAHRSWAAAALIIASPVYAAGTPSVLGVPVEFMLFALTLLGVALFHHHTLRIALIGLMVISLYKITFSGFDEGTGAVGWILHLQHEWVVLTNLFGLLIGFSLLARHFEDSGVPRLLPRLLPDDWQGAFVLLVMVFVLSSFLDNIAAALIGGTVAASVFRRRVHIGYLAAIVAASNAGGSGSVVGDTTTTMMWIAGVSPAGVANAYSAAVVALLVFGLVAARQQHAYQPVHKDATTDARVDWVRLTIVTWILVAAIGSNVFVNSRYPQVSGDFPFICLAVWLAILLALPVRKPEWSLLPDAVKGSLFLLSLVVCASMMPVETLPPASWQTAFGLGFVSAVFDNIPLTALALTQGGYDWGVLAYAVGFGGSMIWFGSSAGVALSTLFPEARSVSAWLRSGWHLTVAYVIGFFAMLAFAGWQPQLINPMH